MGKTGKNKKSSASETAKLPKAECDVCGKMITTKVLARHIKETHSSDSTLIHKCDMCTFETKRSDRLLDHKRRIHFEPIPPGRPTKREKCKRRRSPFRKEEFTRRHTESIKINGAMTGKLVGMKTDNEELKIRMAIVERKHKTSKIPALYNIDELLRFFGLDKSSSLNEIRDEINTKILETSPESLVSSATDMTDDQRDEFLSFLNQAQVVLLQWKRENND